MISETAKYVLIMVILLGSCEDLRPPTMLAEKPQPSFAFPTAHNSEWVYAIFDTTDKSYDTATVRMIGNLGPAQLSIALLVLQSSKRSDSISIRRAFDTLSFHLTPGLLGEDFTLVYPLVREKYWFQPDDGAGQFYVSSIDSVYVPAGTFTDAAKVMYAYGYHTSSRITYWMAPNVGVVQILKEGFGRNFAGKETWTLLSYHIPD